MVQSRPPVDKSDRNCKRSAVKKHWQNGHGATTDVEKSLVCSNLVYGDLTACFANWEKSSGERVELLVVSTFKRVNLPLRDIFKALFVGTYCYADEPNQYFTSR